MTAPIATNQKTLNSSIAKQLINICTRNPHIFDNLDFGELKIECRSGNIYRLLISRSVLVKPEDTEE